MSKNFKKGEPDVIKKLYEDTILNGRFFNSTITNSLAGRLNKYGERRQIEATLKAEMAASIISSLPKGDEEVARGITIGIELGKPNFEKLGQEFLAEHIPEYTKSGLAVALTKVMLHGISGERIDEICQGVEGVLEGKADVSEEAKAARMAITIYDLSSKFKDRNDFNGVSTAALSRVFRATEKNGTVCTSDPEYLKLLSEFKSQRDVLTRNPKRKQEMNTTYKYFSTQFEKIPESFRVALDGYDTETIIAYYVASMREDEIHQIYVRQEEVEK